MAQFPSWEAEIMALPFLMLGFRVKQCPGDARWSCQEQLLGRGCSRGVPSPYEEQQGAGMEGGAASPLRCGGLIAHRPGRC